jgi:hypothetical protein
VDVGALGSWRTPLTAFPTRQKSPDEDESQKSVTNVDRNASGSSCPINKGVVVIAIKRVRGLSAIVVVLRSRLGGFSRRKRAEDEERRRRGRLGEGIPRNQQQEKKRFWLSTPGRPNKPATDKFSPLCGYFLVILIRYGINIPYGKSISCQLVLLTVSNDRPSPVQ